MIEVIVEVGQVESFESKGALHFSGLTSYNSGLGKRVVG